MKLIDKLQLQEALLKWYEKEKRDLPWRRSNDPYKIWISEVMLQQTQVQTVIDYYIRFTEALPDVEALANADEELIYKLWEGLGYYSRAKRLKQCAIVLTQKYGGQFPRSFNEVLKLPGIGPYTAGAVLSIAYNLPLPAVDGNVMRVLSRVYDIDSDIGKVKTRKEFEGIASDILPADARHFNQALMELGAVICTPKNPICNQCPLNSICTANRLGNQHLRPVKMKRMAQKKVEMEAAYVVHEGKVLFVKRPSEGLLANLWGLPIVEKDNNLKDGETIVQELQEVYDIMINHIQLRNGAKHVFSHKIWDMKCYLIEAKDKVVVDFPYIQWIDEDKFDEVALPTAFKKLI